jgi:hypothetical protein
MWVSEIAAIRSGGPDHWALSTVTRRMTSVRGSIRKAQTARA